MQSQTEYLQTSMTRDFPRTRWERQRATEWTLPGLCSNTRVTTSFGEMPVQGLRANDPVRKDTGTFIKVAATDKMHLDDDFLSRCPDAAPVRIPANCFGPGRPRADLTVSPHQMVATSMNPAAPEFRRARDLLGRPGVMREPTLGLTYFLFHCGAPATINVEGVLIPTAP